MAEWLMQLRMGTNRKIQRGWKVQRLNPSCNFLNRYEQGKTTLVKARQGIKTQNDENL